MEEGTVYIRGTLLGLLMVGFSHQNLYFQPVISRDDKVLMPAAKDMVVLESGGSTEAWRCERCRMTLLAR